MQKYANHYKTVSYTNQYDTETATGIGWMFNVNDEVVKRNRRSSLLLSKQNWKTANNTTCMCWNTNIINKLRFIPSALPVMSRLTSSFICQLISVIITTLIINHSFTLLLCENLPFQQTLPTLILLLQFCPGLHITGPDLSCFSIYFKLVSFNFSVCSVW